MHSHTNFVLTYQKATKEELKAVGEYLENLFSSDWFAKKEVRADILVEGSSLEITENYTVVYIEDLMEFAENIAKLAPNAEFAMDGTVDTSETAGEYMDFSIEYSDREVVVHYSEWYVYLGLYDSYEDFCEEFDEVYGEHRYTEEQFEELMNSDEDWFVIEDSEKTLIRNVPLSNQEILYLGEDD